MATARERFLALVKANPDLTATEAARQIGVARQRVQQLAAAEGITLARYVRGSTRLVELAGTDERARRTLDTLRQMIADAQHVERQLAQQLAKLDPPKRKPTPRRKK